MGNYANSPNTNNASERGRERERGRRHDDDAKYVYSTPSYLYCNREKFRERNSGYGISLSSFVEKSLQRLFNKGHLYSMVLYFVIVLTFLIKCLRERERGA
ncbi:hypothetical protein Hdeb2414_s0005g00157571 [Helianthus debilis subsp. tardiflorus]